MHCYKINCHVTVFLYFQCWLFHADSLCIAMIRDVNFTKGSFSSQYEYSLPVVFHMCMQLVKSCFGRRLRMYHRCITSNTPISQGMRWSHFKSVLFPSCMPSGRLGLLFAILVYKHNTLEILVCQYWLNRLEFLTNIGTIHNAYLSYNCCHLPVVLLMYEYFK